MAYQALTPTFADRLSAVRATAGVQTPSRASTVAVQRPAAGAVATESRGLMAGGLGMMPKANSPTAYLVVLVIGEALLLAGLRNGFKHYHGG